MANDNHRLSDTRYLTGIRGLAVLIVLLGHISHTGAHFIPGIDLRGNAKAGVWLFFILSAHLLTAKLIDEIRSLGTSRALLRYSVRRVFRIMPTYIFLLACLWLLSQMTGEAAVRHALLIQGDQHLWTIPVEMKFYLLLPFFVLALLLVDDARRWSLAAFFVLFGLAMYFACDPRKIAENTISLFNYLPFFAVGALLAVLPSSRLQRRYGWVGIIALVGLSPSFFTLLTGQDRLESFEWAWLSALAWGLVIYGAQGGMLRPLLNARPITFLGEISFSLYLVHFAIIFAIMDNFPPSILTGAFMVAASIVIAYLVFKCVEEPTRDLGYRLTKTRPCSRAIAESAIR